MIGLLNKMEKHKLAFLLKTYSGDFNYAKRLINSFVEYNSDKIPLYVVVPLSEINIFKELVLNSDIFLINEENITDELVKDTSVRGIRPGYINQEIIKLAFWESNICENYFCIDSDAVFIRPFFISDFMFNETTPYTIISEDNELKVDPEYYYSHWIEREKLISDIKVFIDFEDSRMLTCHSFAIFSSKVLRSFKENFLLERGLNYIDIMKISPYEFSWYNMWLQKSKDIEIQIKEPLIKFFHQKSQHLEYINRGITLNDLARGFIGYNINSNYSRDLGVLNYADYNKYSVRDISYKEIINKLYIFFSILTKRLIQDFIHFNNYIMSIVNIIILKLKNQLNKVSIPFIRISEFILDKFSIENKIHQKRKKLSKAIFSDFNGIVKYGYFKGFSLGESYKWGSADAASMLLGFYEKEILERLVLESGNRRTLIDLGAADGYYAVGTLFGNIFDRTICFEISEESRRNILENSKINNVENNIIIKGAVNNSNLIPELMNENVKYSESVMLCDIDGGEFDPFNDDVLSQLNGLVIIIEIHEWHKNGLGNYNLLKSRASKYFNLEEITMGSRDLSKYLEIRHLRDDFRWLLCSEGRHHLMTWLVLTPKYL